MPWHNNILGFVTPTDWLDIDFRVQRPNDPADQIFGDKKTENLVAEWQTIASEYKHPMAAMFHAFDSEAQKTVRYPVDSRSVEKGLIKVKIDQSEQLRQHINGGVQGDQALYRYVVNDGLQLAEEVITRTKMAKNELLASGKVTIKENGLNLTVDYGVPTANTQLTLDFSASATKNLVEQLDDIVEASRATGTIINGIYTSSSVLSRMRRDSSLQKIINGTAADGQLLTKTKLNSYLSEELGIQRVIVNDDVYNANATVGANGRVTVQQKRYYPQNRITFFSAMQNGKIGTGLWGDPPELDVQQLISVKGSRRPYVYITQWSEHDPAVLWTKASTLFMPVLYDPNSLRVATVNVE